jgi:periplasmic copper chaperone A
MPFRLAVWAILLLLPASLAAAEEDEDHVAQKGDVRVVHAWSRATDADEGVVFMDIESLGGGGDRLTGAESGAAERVEIHGAVLKDGELASQPLDTVEIPAGGEFVLEPGAVFLKLVGLKQPLQQGEEFEVELLFAEAGELDVYVLVEAADATQHSHAGHAH